MDIDFLDDLPHGPLDPYRKKASFNWKKLKIIFEDPTLYKLKLKVWSTLESDPLFHRPEKELSESEMKRRTALQLNKFINLHFLPSEILGWPYKRKTRQLMSVNESVAVYCPDMSIKHAIGYTLITNALLTLGTERHRQIYEAVWGKRILACLALTEVAHGSNTKKMRTMATFDKTTQEFVINTPDFEAAKCWVGNLGIGCTIALLFAQLYTNGQCHGLHAFIVPVRDPKTLLPYPGIVVGDIGEKCGLNGIDNGFIMFENVRIPRENLLNRTADVTPEGEYESSFSEPGKILGAALENLSTGRVGIMQESTHHLMCAVTIAIRYAAIRKQFGPGEEEIPIIEYQLHQWRLFPYVAAASVIKIFVDSFADDYLEGVQKTNTSNSSRIDSMSDLVSEIHAIISSEKPLITWTCMAAIQECREACGGHGYLRAARLGELRNINDPSVTYEGDNNVLSQQTSNWLLRQWNNMVKGEGISSPLETCSFLENYKSILKERYVKLNNVKEILNFNFIIKSYEWLITYLLFETYRKQNYLIKKGEDRFTARNNSQVYRASALSRAYSEYVQIRYFTKKLANCFDLNVRIVLENLGLLYGLSCMEKLSTYFYEGGFARTSQFVSFIREGILVLCRKLKNEIVTVIDALAPPDYVVNSVLGRADGKLYQSLQKAFLERPGAMARPDWWYEIVIPDAPEIKIASKL